MSIYVAVLLLGSVLAHDDILSSEHVDDRGCGTTHYMEDMLANNPDWKAALDQFEIDYALRENKIKSGEISPAVNTVTIPVVYHVLYNTNAQNVPDSTIAYQNNRLQLDFSATNQDYGSTPPAFTSPVDLRSGDFGFTVVNDQVIRKATSTSSFGTNNNIKFDNSGGSSVVDPASKLNFWSGPLSGGLLGYAQFPGGNPNTDGVVQLWSSLSPEVGGNSPYNLGRTGTHEIGHWLNLRHIWGDSNSCTINDGVDDTPAQSGPNYGCPNPNNARRSCPSQNPYPYDMYCNYMDYVNDACMVMFSRGQYDRAWASIFQFRQGFNPSSIVTADVEYVNWLYFIEYDHEITNNEEKCYGGSQNLFYDNNINENSGSDKYIYGCTQKTKSTNVRHISDIQFRYGLNSECPEGWEQATQNLNAGNDETNPIYMCYLREESSMDNNEAVLDMTFVRDGDAARFTQEWTIFEADNINPNGVSLHLAIKKGKYIHSESNLLQNDSEPETASTTITNNVGPNASIIVASLCGLIGVLVIAFVVWKFVCLKSGFKKAIQTNDESLMYGSTELSQVEPEIK